MLTAHTSPLPPHTWGPGSVNQHSSHVDSQPASTHNSPVLYIYPPMTPIKPVYSQLLSVTVTVVIGTCTVLVGAVEFVPVPPQVHITKIFTSTLLQNMYRQPHSTAGQ